MFVQLRQLLCLPIGPVHLQVKCVSPSPSERYNRALLIEMCVGFRAATEQSNEWEPETETNK